MKQVTCYDGGTEYANDYRSGSRVTELQRRLAQCGIMGPETRRAIRAYQRDHGY
jgi:peptidoglycan hydrolase-like protein with peptidoglycan-binding domain